MQPKSLFTIGTGSISGVGSINLSGNSASGGAASSVIDTSNVDFLAIHVFSSGTATFVFETTIDGTHWDFAPATQASDNSYVGSAGTSTAGGWYVVHALGTQVRIRVTSYTSGTIFVRGGQAIGAGHVI